MKKIKKILALLIAIVVITTFIGCSNGSTTTTYSDSDSTQASERDAMDISNNSVGIEMRRSEKIQLGLDKVQPQPLLEWSLERDNIIRRTELWNEKNKISYIYLLGRGGNIITYHTVKGKVSSVNSGLSTPEQIVKDPNIWKRSNGGGAGSSMILPSPQEDGSYGTNGDAIFFFTTSGIYVEWNGDYYLSDSPMKLNVQPIMVETTVEVVE